MVIMESLKAKKKLNTKQDSNPQPIDWQTSTQSAVLQTCPHMVGGTLRHQVLIRILYSNVFVSFYHEKGE